MQVSYKTASPELIAAIHQALLRPARPYRISLAAWPRGAAPGGWVLLSQLWEMLEGEDSRLSLLSCHSKALCAVFELPLRWVMHRPRSHLIEAMMHHAALSPVDAAALMVHLNKLGFSVDPAALVQMLLPKLQHELLSEAERDVLFFSKMRDRSRLTLSTEAEPAMGADVQTSRLATGHAIEFRQCGEASSVTVRGPRFRERPRVKGTCETCGQDFCHGDLESLLDHRKYHQRHARSHNPKALPAMAERVRSCADPEVANEHSPLWLHSEVYERALWFKREMKFDLIQYPAPKDRHSVEEAVGYVFTTEDEPARIVGACVLPAV
jgi:hypothetical protein